MSVQSFLLLLLLPRLVSLFQTNLQMYRDNVPGCFRETDCLVTISCPGSFLPQAMQQELLG